MDRRSIVSRNQILKRWLYAIQFLCQVISKQQKLNNCLLPRFLLRPLLEFTRRNLFRSFLSITMKLSKSQNHRQQSPRFSLRNCLNSDFLKSVTHPTHVCESQLLQISFLQWPNDIRLLVFVSEFQSAKLSG